MAVVYGQFGLGGPIQTTVVLISTDQTLIYFTGSIIGPKNTVQAWKSMLRSLCT